MPAAPGSFFLSSDRGLETFTGREDVAAPDADYEGMEMILSVKPVQSFVMGEQMLLENNARAGGGQCQEDRVFLSELGVFQYC